jgi:hypothetical protein
MKWPVPGFEKVAQVTNLLTAVFPDSKGTTFGFVGWDIFFSVIAESPFVALVPVYPRGDVCRGKNIVF